MSWEAVTWATKQRMKSSHEQLVLLVLANAADPDGVAFARWPGRDHWWKYLVDLTRLSKSTLFRDINTLIDLGLCARSMIVMADGTRRPTIELDLSATYKFNKEDAVHSHPGDHSHTGNEADDDGVDDENSPDYNAIPGDLGAGEIHSHTETSPTGGTEPFPVVGMQEDSLSCSKESPPTPQGGPSASDDGFEEFQKTWARPIERLSVARTAWGHIATAKRGEAVAAARGYFVWLGKQAKPPAPVSAQTFLREIAGWSQWLPWAGSAGSAVPSSLAFAADSVEAKAITTLYEIAGKGDFFRQVHRRADGTVNYPKPFTPRLAALSHAPSDWPELNRQQAAAWEGFLRETVTVQVRKHLKEGDRAPWPWPPSAEGKIYPTGPPQTLMSEQDAADFK